MKWKEHFERIGIKGRIFASFAGFTAVILVLLWVFQVVFLNSFYKAIKTREIKTSAQTIARNIDSGNLSATVQSLSQRNQMCIIAVSYTHLTLPTN